MAVTNLDNTLNGMDVKAGEEQLYGLPPEAQAVLEALSAISSAPTPEMLSQGQATAQAAFNPLLEQLKAQGNEAAPAQTSPFGQFLTLLASGIAGSVRPEFGVAGPKALEQQREEMQQFKTRKQGLAKEGLELAQKMTIEGLKLAQDAGDDKAATQKAIQLKKLEDILARQRTTERIGAEGKERRLTVEAAQKARVRAGVQLRTALNKITEASNLSDAGKARLRAHAGFLVTVLDNATRLDPSTGEPAKPFAEALQDAQKQFDLYYNEQLEREGKKPKEAEKPKEVKADDPFQMRGLLGK